jgi:FKBP-type peptidyl-prolyl cis-trans isomerase
MRRKPNIAIAVLLLAVVSVVIAQDKPVAKPTAGPADVRMKASYCIGVSIGRNFKEQGLELDSAQVLQGLRDALTDAKIRFADAEMQQILEEYQTLVTNEQQAKAKSAAEANKKEGAAFLAENGKKAGVKTTASGLQYQVIKEGSGSSPKATDNVSVHYKGALLNGTEFDSSYKRGTPATFPLNGVIKGWTEGVQLMKVGGTTRFFIPSELAYGENPRPGGPIGPNAVLIFDVELLGIKD